jgi:hypothetical protein
MKIKTADLIGPALDWAVTKCEGRREPALVNNFAVAWYTWPNTHYSTNWSQGGPIIEKEMISIGHAWNRPVWLASEHNIEADLVEGPTPLIAAMRCYCCAKLGDEVEIPQELQLCQQPNL